MAQTSKTLDEIKTPLFATFGIGDLAISTVVDVAAKLRERAEVAASEVQKRVVDSRERLSNLQEELPTDVNELRARLTAEELRKAAESSAHAATEFYNSLAERGEEAYDRLRKQPAIEETLEKVESYASDAVEQAHKLAARAGIRIGDSSEPVTIESAVTAVKDVVTPAPAAPAPAPSAPAPAAKTPVPSNNSLSS